jgi:hypothetical protein
MTRKQRRKLAQVNNVSPQASVKQEAGGSDVKRIVKERIGEHQ